MLGVASTDAGAVAEADSIAKWDGSSWSALGTGMDGEASVCSRLDGNNLYAAGYFSNAGGNTVNRYR
jgi:hypothetical protein